MSRSAEARASQAADSWLHADSDCLPAIATSALFVDRQVRNLRDKINQGTTWTSAPLFARPDQTLRVGRRTYDLYYQGSHLRTVAWLEHGAGWPSPARRARPSSPVCDRAPAARLDRAEVLPGVPPNHRRHSPEELSLSGRHDLDAPPEELSASSRRTAGVPN
jgi:hypothetical protein